MATNRKPYGLPYRDAVREFAIRRGAKHAKLNVLSALLQSCNGDTGTCYPGNNLIMKRANTPSKDTLWRALKFLEGQGIIKRVAFPDGGRGRSVCWGFGLPAWTTLENLDAACEALEENSPKTGDVSETKTSPILRQNLPENASKPPRKSGNQPKEPERTERGAAFGLARKEPPSRRQAAPSFPQNEVEQVLFSQWEREGSPSEAMGKLKRWREDQAIAAE